MTLHGGTRDGGIRVPLEHGSSLVFAADDGVAGSELWTSDGSDAGTTLVADVRVGADASSPDRSRAAAGRAFFTADDGVTGRGSCGASPARRRGRRTSAREHPAPTRRIRRRSPVRCG